MSTSKPSFCKGNKRAIMKNLNKDKMLFFTVIMKGLSLEANPDKLKDLIWYVADKISTDYHLFRLADFRRWDNIRSQGGCYKPLVNFFQECSVLIQILIIIDI